MGGYGRITSTDRHNKCYKEAGHRVYGDTQTGSEKPDRGALCAWVYLGAQKRFWGAR